MAFSGLSSSVTIIDWLIYMFQDGIFQSTHPLEFSHFNKHLWHFPTNRKLTLEIIKYPNNFLSWVGFLGYPYDTCNYHITSNSQPYQFTVLLALVMSNMFGEVSMFSNSMKRLYIYTSLQSVLYCIQILANSTLPYQRFRSFVFHCATKQNARLYFDHMTLPVSWY